MLGLLLLALGVVLTVLAGATMGWYPARIGGPANWLDDNLYRVPVSVLERGPWWPAAAGLVFIAALGLTYGGYALAARRAARLGRGCTRDFVLVLVGQAILNVWLAIQPYLSSQDIFSYAFYAHILVWYRANPYVVTPRDFPFDPLFSAIFWKDQASNYGPLWTYVSALAPLIAGWRTGPSILVLKAITIAAAIGGTPLLWDAADRLRPARRVLVVTLYAWSPLLLIEAGEAGHNDIVMAFFLILAIWCWSRDRRTASFAALMLAALAKYVAILLAPLFLILWLREEPNRTWSVLLRVGAVGLGLTVAAFAPLYAGVQTLAVVGFGSNALAYTNSPLELAFRQIRVVLGESQDVANLPLHYEGYWVADPSSTILWSEPDMSRATGIALPTGEPLLVVELPAGEWLHVYEPRVGRFGFVEFRGVQPIAAPHPPPASGVTETVLEGAGQDPLAQRSNLILRIASLLLFLPGYYLIARRVRDRSSLLRACLAVLLYFLLVVQSWFWPWYLLWALPFAAIEWDTFGGRTLLLLTATTSILNAQPSISPPAAFEWLFEGRMLLIDGLPIIVVALIWWNSTEAGKRSLRAGWNRTRAVLAIAGHTAKRLSVPVVASSALLVGMVAGAMAYKSSGTANASPSVIAWQRAYSDAQRRYSAGDYEGSVQDLDQVLDARPHETSAITLRIEANLAMQRYADTIPDLNQLIAEDPSNVDVLLNRGNMYEQIQRYDRATADYTQVTTLAPDIAAGYEGLGQVAFQQGDLDQARIWLTRARGLAPRDEALTQQLASVDASEGDVQSAMTLYDEAILLDPRDAQTYADRAALLQHAGLADATVPDLQKVVVLSGDVQQNQWAARLLSSIEGAEAALAGRIG